jgi:hypothetical protein
MVAGVCHTIADPLAASGAATIRIQGSFVSNLPLPMSRFPFRSPGDLKSFTSPISGNENTFHPMELQTISGTECAGRVSGAANHENASEQA